MNKKLTRTLAGVMSLMFMGQIMIFGDGSAQDLLHADTIASAAEAIEGAKNKDQLAKEFEEATKDLGKVDFFDVTEDKKETANNEEIAEDDISVQSESDEAVQDHTAVIATASDGDAPAGELTVTGIVKQGDVNGIKDKTPIYVRIFDENWNEIEYQELRSGDSYSVTASSGSGIYHVKYESDGYLPFYLKDFGTGTYTVGSGASRNTVTLVPGDTTWNEEHDNEWSDDVINGKDLAYVQSCLGAYRGDDAFNFSMDLDDDGKIDQAELLDAQNAINSASESQQDANAAYIYDLNGDACINHLDMYIMASFVGYDSSEISDLDFNGNGIIDEEDLNSYISIIYQSMDVYWYNLDLNHNGVIDENDAEFLEAAAKLRGPSDNYYAYMDKDDSGTIDNADVAWFSAAYKASGDLDWDHAFKRTLIMQESGAFQGSLNLHDTDLNLNGCSLYVGDCMSFTTDIPKFWSGNQGATLNISNGYLEVSNNLVFRTASPDGWGGNAGQNMRLNGGTVVIGGDFNFGQANCYDTIWMTNSADWLEVYGNWNYITLTDMEGKWTAGNICFYGPTWEVNEASGPKSIYSSGSQVIHFGYEGGKQTVLWDNCETYINNEDGSLNTERTFNFDGGIDFIYDFTAENYWFRPWWRPYDEPDYTLYRKGWEMGDGVHPATGNYTKTFVDLAVKSPGMDADFVRTYNSTNTEEGSFGIGWDFNLDVSKIIQPAENYYQVVLPNGSNTTFKQNGTKFECENAHSTMEKNSSGYVVTLNDQTKYYFNNKLEMYRMEDPHGDTIEISAIDGNHVRTVTDSTGRQYKITYTSNDAHKRITKIEDPTSGRIVEYTYDNNNQLASAKSILGAVESYSYDDKKHLNKITNCYDEVTEEMVYYSDGRVDYLTNSSGLKQIYQYDKAKKQTSIKEYDNGKYVKETKCDYDEKLAVKTNIVYTDGQTFEIEKATYTKDSDGKNKYDEIGEYADENGNITKNTYDKNGNLTDVINPDGSKTYSRYNSKNYMTVSVDECNNVTLKEYDNTGVMVIREAQSIHPYSDVSAFLSDKFNVKDYLNNHASEFAITTYEYCTAGEQHIIHGLIRRLIDPEGNVTEYVYNADGTVKQEWKYAAGQSKQDGGCTSYEYNDMFLISKTTSPGGNVTETTYDKMENVVCQKEYGKGSSPAVTRTQYDLLGRVIKEVSPNAYDAALDNGSEYDSGNAKTNYASHTYYPSGLVKTDTDAVGNVTSYEYDAYGNLTVTTHPNDSQSIAVYDGLGREIKTYFKDHKYSSDKLILTTTSYALQKNYAFKTFNGVEKAVTDSAHNGLLTTKTQYITAKKQVVSTTLTDYRGNTVQEKVNDKVKRTNTYYANGNLGSETDAKGNVTKYAYDTLNKQTAKYTPFTKESNGTIEYSITKNGYDKNGNVISGETTIQKQVSGKEAWSKVTYAYDYLGNMTQTVLYGDGDTKNYTQYFYDKDGLRTKMYTGMSSENDTDRLETLYEYDDHSNLVRTIERSNNTETYNSGTLTYDLNKNVIQSIDSNGNRTTKTYDALNRILTSDTVCDDTSKDVSQKISYDKMGQTIQVVQNGKTTTFIYDALGRLTEEHSPDCFKGYYYVGSTENKEKLLLGQSNLLIYGTTEYEYDDEMRLSKVSDTGKDSVSYTYDENGNKASAIYGNGTKTEYSYNLSNHVTSLVNKKSNEIISQYDYTYYLDGSDACKTRTESGIIETTSYDYDRMGRLVSESEVNGNISNNISYEYDDYSNRSQMTVSGEEDYVTTYNYSSNGHYTGLLQKESKKTGDVVRDTVYTYDANGNQLTKNDPDDGLQTNTYDGLNELIGVQNGEMTASYTYGYDGLRRTKTVNGKTTTHVYDGQELMVDIGKSVYEADVYVRGTGLISSRAFYNGMTSDVTYYLQNAHGDVVNLTSETGDKTKTYRYDAFGVEKNSDENDENPFRFSGEYFDKETGTIYLRARYYDPEIGRFISRDTVIGTANDPLSLNLYTYCRNNPIPLNDPDGHFWGLVAKAAIGAVINVAVTAVCDYLDDGEFNSGAGEYLSAAATGALSAVISPAKCAENIAKRMVKSGLKEAAIGAVGDGIKQLADGEFDPKEMAINAGKNFVSGALNGKFNASCFAAGTMIETADGDRTIEEIQIGDLVLSANPETGEIAYKPVVNTYVHVTDTVLYLTIDEEIIETTEDHPFWVEGQGWTSAKLLQPGDVVWLKDGSTQCVDDIEIVELPEGEYVAVYNFEVADFHTYFVSDYDVLVHNDCKNKVEKVLPTESSYERARNKALKEVGDLGADSKPLYGRLKTSAGHNKIIGRQSADGKRRWRLDYDKEKGPHFNVEIFSKGKGKKATKIAIPFKGDEATFKKHLRVLNRR